MSYQYYAQWDDLDESIQDYDDDIDIDIDCEENEGFIYDCRNCSGCNDCLT